MRDNVLLSLNNLRVWEKQATIDDTRRAGNSSQAKKVWENLEIWFPLLIMMGILVEIVEVVWNPLGRDALFVLDFETFVLECEGIEESS